MMIMKRNSNGWKVLFYKTLGSMLVISLLAACKSKTVTTGSATGITKSEEAVFSAVLARTFRFNTFSARIRLEIQLPEKNMSSRAHLKMIHNDCIQLSIQPLPGMEMFRIELTKDSAKIIDRMNKCYMTESYEKMKGKTKIDFNFYNLQSLFTNNIFLPGENEVSIRQLQRFRMAKNPGTIRLVTNDDAGLLYTFIADKDEKLLSTILHDPNETYIFTCEYLHFQRVNKQRFPFQMKAGLRSDDKTQGMVKLTFSKPEVDIPVKTDFKIPSGYKRITFSQIIQSLEKQ